MVIVWPLLIRLAIPGSILARIDSLTVFIGTDQKAVVVFPPGICLWFFTSSLRHPLNPLKDASLKHLTFKTIFLLALASGKRRSEIHAWLHKNIRHQTDWSKVSLYPSPSFLAKNHLAGEGPGSVALVVIHDLAPTLDQTLKEDRSLCPVRALRYHLDRTKDLC